MPQVAAAMSVSSWAAVAGSRVRSPAIVSCHAGRQAWRALQSVDHILSPPLPSLLREGEQPRRCYLELAEPDHCPDAQQRRVGTGCHILQPLFAQSPRSSPRRTRQQRVRPARSFAERLPGWSRGRGPVRAADGLARSAVRETSVHPPQAGPRKRAHRRQSGTRGHSG